MGLRGQNSQQSIPTAQPKVQPSVSPQPPSNSASASISTSVRTAQPPLHKQPTVMSGLKAANVSLPLDYYIQHGGLSRVDMKLSASFVPQIIEELEKSNNTPALRQCIEVLQKFAPPRQSLLEIKLEHPKYGIVSIHLSESICLREIKLSLDCLSSRLAMAKHLLSTTSPVQELLQHYSLATGHICSCIPDIPEPPETPASSALVFRI